ncbi:bifunctional precorrin-2 dehydrogenase/sirohydrochlorin ferrochelatase [Shewanella eurypsychrophilus]|uniref:precorrin-2 dehydrogenase n=1 Tax=Shewanella eurypsychrophilus TaxID=2593656 RepID=A0ABX6V7H6_9GAMM|nr:MULTISPECIES: bifunctional precorrin-2 dehydrogenase/sirohydrochlorin ferrochelatase [Shewanella]QFU23366.1 bifunctional precorrin-2 dehydrogenase/sirohydrochlorin ferrochelatase [Shewanella sp. YLB-09]QPG58597.1 bifunctional precorrin-2 dehydrogenase/sirohydrochlorin ferrochelatase [Shewanella eurypsychrophilus]
MQYFPLFVDTSKLTVLLVGAGDVASRKLELLARTEAVITVIAVDISDEVYKSASQDRITIINREVKSEDITDFDLVYLATADDVLNTKLAAIARERGIWVNVVDNPKQCSFITPSIVDRGRLQIAISTAGAAPIFARELRARLESWLPQSLAPLFDFVASRRNEVQQRLPQFKQRKLFWEHFFRANGDKFDDDTAVHYDNGFQNLSLGGELLLIDDETPASLLPIAAMPLMQKLDQIFSTVELPFALNEFVRRDANRGEIPILSELSELYESGQRCLVYADKDKVAQLKAHFPMAKHLTAGTI